MPTSDEIVRELEAFYRSYIEAFNREDIDLFTEAFCYPYAWVTGERGLTVCANESDHQRWFGQMMVGIKDRGWVRSGSDRLNAWALAENLAMIMADVTRYKSDGSILEQIRACYTLRRDGKAWKIVTASVVPPPFLGPGNLPR
jgi:ketosteroid isomerase-like protein